MSLVRLLGCRALDTLKFIISGPIRRKSVGATVMSMVYQYNSLVNSVLGLRHGSVFLFSARQSADIFLLDSPKVLIG